MKNNLDTATCISVFGASSSNLQQEFLDDARLLGTLMAQHGWTCVNGAGCEGLMRAVSDGVLDAGGEAIGVIPQFMVDNGWHYDRLSSIIVTASMHERKHTMARMTQAVVALPGGCGTMEELLEVITWRQLKIITSPIIILNTLGYYDPLVDMLNRAIDNGFMKKSHGKLWQVVSTPQEAIDAIDWSLTHNNLNIESKY